MPAVEVLVVNGLVAEALADADGASRLERLMSEGDYYGMQTFDQSLLKLYQRGLVDRATVLAHATYAPSLQVDIERIERIARAPATAGRRSADRRRRAHRSPRSPRSRPVERRPKACSSRLRPRPRRAG